MAHVVRLMNEKSKTVAEASPKEEEACRLQYLHRVPSANQSAAVCYGGEPILAVAECYALANKKMKKSKQFS